jgi:hypothetical protein
LEKLAEKEPDEHGKLLQSVVLLVIGLIILVSGLIGLSWVTALLGAALSAFGAFEVRHFYVKISYENKSIGTTQNGSRNFQANQTNPTNSPMIQKADNVYIGGTEAKGRKEIPSKKAVEESDERAEWLCKGEIHIDRYQEFEARMSKGDRVEGHVESKEPITVQIMSQRDYQTLAEILDGEIDEDEEYSSYFSTPSTTDYDFSWTSTVNRTIVLVISGGTKDEEGEFIATVTARIKIIRGKQAQT